MAGLFGGRGSQTALSAVSLVAAAGLVWAGPAQAAGTARRPAAGTITTVAGGIGGPGPAVNVAIRACGVKFSAGALYIGGGDLIRRVDPRTGQLSTVATGMADGYYIDEGAYVPGGACGVTVDSAGNVLVADADRVRVLAERTGRFYGLKMTARHVYTIAGQKNVSRYIDNFGNGGLATKALLSDAVDVELDPAGNVVIADQGQAPYHLEPNLGALVWVVAERSGRFYGQQMTARHAYVVAGTPQPTSTPVGGLATQVYFDLGIGTVRVDRTGNLVVADASTRSVRVVAVRRGTFYGQRMAAGHIYDIAGGGHGAAAEGRLGTSVALAAADGVALDHAGNVMIADCARLWVVAASNGRFYNKRMLTGHIYSIAGIGPDGGPYGDCSGMSDAGDGGPARQAKIVATGAVTVDSAGNVLFADASEPFNPFGPPRVRAVAVRAGDSYGRMMRAGDVYTIAGTGQSQSSGDGLLATRAELTPDAVTQDHAGNLVVTDSRSNRVRMVAAASGRFFGRLMASGHIYTIAGGGRYGYSGDGGPATRAGLSTGGVAADAAGNVLIADLYSGRVRVVAARPGTFYGQKMLTGDIYTIAGDGQPGYSGDGGPATQAGLSAQWLAVDHAGNVLVSESVNARVRLVAARSGTFYGQKMTAGDIYTIAGDGKSEYSGDGGPATQAGVVPEGIALDRAGNVVEADTSSNRVRVVAAQSGMFYGQKMTAGDIYTIAGDGQFGNSGDGGPATAATFEGTLAVAIDRAGNVAVCDANSPVVRMIAAKSGTYFGHRMKAGDIYTIAGGGKRLGDGGPATQAALGPAAALAVSRAGNLLITTGDRVRSVKG
jgi:hypothetical protein